ncbi:hypothetical protein KCU88_g240, partial [Aureobasidium melanogenum]
MILHNSSRRPPRPDHTALPVDPGHLVPWSDFFATFNSVKWSPPSLLVNLALALSAWIFLSLGRKNSADASPNIAIMESISSTQPYLSAARMERASIGSRVQLFNSPHDRIRGGRIHEIKVEKIVDSQAFEQKDYSSQSRKHLPGPTRPARPARWPADARLQGTTTKDSIPVRGLYWFSFTKPGSITYTIPSIVREVSAIFWLAGPSASWHKSDR